MVGLVVEGIEDLYFREALNKDTTVSTTLALTGNLSGGGPLDMEMSTGEQRFFESNASLTGRDLHEAAFNFPADFPYDLNALSQAAGIIELVGGALVLIGCVTRPVAFICAGTMAVAYWMVHGLNSFFPMINGGELAALYCFGFLLIAANGPGIWSIDNFLSTNTGEEDS